MKFVSIVYSQCFWLLVTSYLVCNVGSRHARGTESTPAENSKNETTEDMTVALIKFLRHVITSLRWTSIVIVAELSSEEVGPEIARQLTEDNVTITVFQWPSSIRSLDCDNIITRERPNNGFTNVLVLGSGVFIERVLQKMAGPVPFMYRWLTIVSRDQKALFLDTAKQYDNMAVITQHSNVLTLETMIWGEYTTELELVTNWTFFQHSPLPRLTEESVFPNVKHGLNGRTLKMVTMQWDPFIIRHENETNTWYTGLCMDILEFLAADLNFTYTITEPADQIWGSQLPNGMWAGMTGMLQRKEVDFALAGLSVTADRATVSDYTTGFYYDEVVLVATGPDPSHVGWTFFIRPFHWLIYILLGCGLVVMTGVLVWTDRCYVRTYNSSHVAEDRKSEPSMARSVVEAVETLFGTLVGRARDYKGVSSSGRLLMCAWLLLSMVTVATYTGKLTSNSVFTQQPLPFKSLSELLKQTDYKWGLQRGTMVETTFSTSTNKDYQRYYKKLLEFAAADPDVFTYDFQGITVPKVLGGNYVHVFSYSSYDVLKYEHCELAVVQERLFHDTYAVYLQKGSPYTSMFNAILTTAQDTGLLARLTQKWFPEKPGCQGDETTVQAVSLELVQTAFIMAAVGVALAALLLVLERLVRSSRHKYQYTV